MTIGPWHRWFAWRPVLTEQHGWRWLRVVALALLAAANHLEREQS